MAQVVKFPARRTAAQSAALDELSRAIRYSVARCGADWTARAIRTMTTDNHNDWRGRARRLFEETPDA